MGDLFGPDHDTMAVLPLHYVVAPVLLSTGLIHAVGADKRAEVHVPKLLAHGVMVSSDRQAHRGFQNLASAITQHRVNTRAVPVALVKAQGGLGEGRGGPVGGGEVPPEGVRGPVGGLAAGSVVEAGVDFVRVLVTACPTRPEDLDGNGEVNAADLAVILNNWGGSGAGDLDGDGTVGAADLSAVLNAWG